MDKGVPEHCMPEEMKKSYSIEYRKQEEKEEHIGKGAIGNRRNRDKEKRRRE
jgi:hypothetical protein